MGRPLKLFPARCIQITPPLHLTGMKTSNRAGRNLNRRPSMGVEIAVPIAFFGSIIASIWLVSYFNSRKRLTIHETLRHAIDKGQTLSPELLQNMSLVTDPVRADLRRGVLFLAFGAAFGVLAAIVGTEEATALNPMLGIATFPIFLGIAYIGLWAFGRGKSQA
jgi:hypothetical protein